MNAVANFNLNGAATSAYNIYQESTASADSSGKPNNVLVASFLSSMIQNENVGKYSIFDVAEWFLAKGKMTHKKLQKLCYYAQAWCYALNNYRLENTDYEAWVHGPVSRVLWERFKSFGYDTIIFNGQAKEIFDPEDIRILEDVWDTYGKMTGNALEALAHRELPWIEARRGYGPEESCTVVISPSTMASFYKSIYCGD